MFKKDKSLFWDVDPKNLDNKKHADFIIARVLEEGSDEAVAWLLDSYSTSEIERVVCNSRRLSPQTANFWRYRLDIKKPILCLSKSFIQRQNKLWRK